MLKLVKIIIKNGHWLSDIASCAHGISVGGHWPFVVVVAVDSDAFRNCDRNDNQSWPMWSLHRPNRGPTCNLAICYGSVAPAIATYFFWPLW